jgi:hypothetical protein
VGMPQNEQGHLSTAASFSTPVGDPHTPSKRTRSRSPIPEAKSENQRLRIDEATGKVYVASVSPASSGLSPSGSPTPKGIFKYIYIYIYICVCVCACGVCSIISHFFLVFVPTTGLAAENKNTDESEEVGSM